MREHILKTDEADEFHTEEGCFILELSNSPEDPDVSIARARVAPGASTRMHHLRGVAERYVLLQGTGQVEVGELPLKEVRPGTVVLIPPGCPQRITNTGTDDLVFLAICTPRFTPEVYTDREAS
jgi:mannose-6-phosphate isomerase-like protein (cupin superfamily)